LRVRPYTLIMCTTSRTSSCASHGLGPRATGNLHQPLYAAPGDTLASGLQPGSPNQGLQSTMLTPESLLLAPSAFPVLGRLGMPQSITTFWFRTHPPSRRIHSPPLTDSNALGSMAASPCRCCNHTAQAHAASDDDVFGHACQHRPPLTTATYCSTAARTDRQKVQLPSALAAQVMTPEMWEEVRSRDACHCATKPAAQRAVGGGGSPIPKAA